ncbi:MAG: hypothetical protein IKU07_10620 [Oscillospiraceae bacterium]|nr:hypothetical protein [Oscillospiraceae bacterium]
MKKNSRYRQMEQVMTYVLLSDLAMFIIYLFAAGFGIIWLKAITAIIAILVSGLCLWFLYMTQELLKQRSFWMTTAAAAILICVLFSLILNFPSPNPFNELANTVSAITR